MTEVAKDPKLFYQSLIEELTEKRARVSEAEQSFGISVRMSEKELLEWVKFQAWYEQQAASFIGSWLKDTPEEEAFVGLCRQIADEGKHYKLLTSHLASFGASMEGWQPEPEWIEWVVEFYASGNDTLERIAAHNITGEIGALQAFESLLPRIPEGTQRIIKKILPDEKFHVQLGRTIVERYATTIEAQRRVRERVIKAFELEQKGRVAFDRRIQALQGAVV